MPLTVQQMERMAGMGMREAAMLKRENSTDRIMTPTVQQKERLAGMGMREAAITGARLKGTERWSPTVQQKECRAEMGMGGGCQVAEIIVQTE
jgi:hypothetical protein